MKPDFERARAAAANEAFPDPGNTATRPSDQWPTPLRTVRRSPPPAPLLDWTVADSVHALTKMNQPRPGPEMATVICLHCQQPFKALAKRLHRKDRTAPKYCTAKCMGQARIQPPLILHCEHCGDPFEVKASEHKRSPRKYCSLTCHADHRRTIPLTIRQCEFCSNPYTVDSTHKTQRFCSLSCAMYHRNQQ